MLSLRIPQATGRHPRQQRSHRVGRTRAFSTSLRRSREPTPNRGESEIAESEPCSAAGTNPGRCRGDLAGHEAAWPKWRFMIEEKSRTGKKPIRLAVIGR